MHGNVVRPPVEAPGTEAFTDALPFGTSAPVRSTKRCGGNRWSDPDVQPRHVIERDSANA
ncbi:Glycoprotein gp2 [Streptomyces misionensis JCM 4497]